MKIFFPSGFQINQKSFLQKAGYGSRIHSKTGRINFVKRLTTSEYPHFHIYLEKNIDGRSYISLHLDQKKPSYSGARAHNAEYNGEVVQRETHRLKDMIYAIHHEPQKTEHQEKKGFFSRLFQS